MLQERQRGCKRPGHEGERGGRRWWEGGGEINTLRSPPPGLHGWIHGQTRAPTRIARRISPVVMRRSASRFRSFPLALRANPSNSTSSSPLASYPLFAHRMSSLCPARYSWLSYWIEDVDMRDAVKSGIGSRPIAIIVCGRLGINNRDELWNRFATLPLFSRCAKMILQKWSPGADFSVSHFTCVYNDNKSG